jgi:hypothetical protein
MTHMVARKRFTITALAVLIAGVLAVWGVSSHAHAGLQATAVTTTITIPGTEETWAPPPASAAAPAMTAQQAWAKFMQGSSSTAIGPDVTVQLGLITQPIGPYCGPECDGHPVVNGIAYTALNQLAYGYYWSSCPNSTSLPETECQNWFFLDANTGDLITGALPAPDDPRLLPVSPAPSSSSQAVG